MAAAIIGAVAAVASVGASVYSSNQAGKAADKSATLANYEFVQNAQRYDQAQRYLADQAALGQTEYERSVAQLEGGMDLANQQNAAWQGQSDMYGDMAKENEVKMTAQFDNFLDGFSQMLGDNEQAMIDFTRRYGPIMDNVAKGIENVSAAKLSAQGREQLSLDAQNLTKTFNQSMASKNMGRSGVSVEGERRMAMDTAVQARNIDVNSEAQAMQLQGQGIQNLNSMQQGITNLQNQRLGIQQAQGIGQQAVGQAYGNLAQNMYGAQQNAFGQGFAGQQNASNNIANMLGQMGTTRINTNNSFYSGVQAPSAANAINAQNNIAQSHQADASGYMQTAGSLLANPTVQGGLQGMYTQYGNTDNGTMY